MKEHNEIDWLFQSAFDGLELTPDPSVKKNIDQAIASKKKRRRFLFIFFPVLFGLSGLAATLFGYPFSEKTASNKTLTVRKTFAGNKRSTTVLSGKKTSAEKTPPSLLSHASSTLPSKNTSNFVLTNNSVSTDGKLPLEKPGHVSEQTGSKITAKQHMPTDSTEKNTDTLKLAENAKDSMSIPAINLTSLFPDSVIKLLSANQSVGSNNNSRKWSLTVITYWEGEKKRAIPSDNGPFIANQKENARIHSSTCYGKIEMNRLLTSHLEILTGLGFRSSKIIQYGYLEKIEMPVNGLTSGVPQPIVFPDTVQWTETQSFRVNSIVLPIGLVYSFPIGNKIQLRLSGGGEFAYGQFANRQLNPVLSAPKVNPFGFSVWIRPELQYSFGRAQLVGFGTFNQSISQQLRWDFEPRRNPAFGIGMGLRFSL
ncbi:hypothetical protein [Fluviicola chungangensis]|uniref:Uncharacterized protein n=1 Tax=Fluviicola chungangensis TaxID=2597671 RepID=A0A556MGL8_9FLAO|nr:hypothetical protein [Fluviicola chungangensis]TSJ39038.1 hypothetical protein FO442_17840 [Fluviicola chungangensis]